jgi:hypothetical protein
MENGNLSVSLERRLKTCRRLEVLRQCCDRKRARQEIAGPPAFDGSVAGARDEGAGHAPIRHCQSTQDRPRVGLGGCWGSLQRPKVHEIEGTLRYLGWLIADFLEIPLSKFR